MRSMTLQNSKTNTDPMHPKTQGRWHTEKQPDGSTWLIGPDPQDGEDVCIAAFELQQDAEYVARMHNERGEWQNEHPAISEQGWWWYWHPDFRDPVPMRVTWSPDPDDYGWRYMPDRHPALDDRDEEWWKPMPYDPSGPDTPDR